MPTDFRPDSNSAFDALSEVRISFPRILPTTLADGSEGIEYQYNFRHDGERIASLAIYGVEDLSENEFCRERLCTLDLGDSHVLKAIIDFKYEIGNREDAFSFVSAVAQGLVNVFSNQPSAFESTRYVAVARVESLKQFGIDIPAEGSQQSHDAHLLASLLVPQKRAEVG